jgi:hypothetical protein
MPCKRFWCKRRRLYAGRVLRAYAPISRAGWGNLSDAGEITWSARNSPRGLIKKGMHCMSPVADRWIPVGNIPGDPGCPGRKLTNCPVYAGSVFCFLSVAVTLGIVWTVHNGLGRTIEHPVFCSGDPQTKHFRERHSLGHGHYYRC